MSDETGFENVDSIIREAQTEGANQRLIEEIRQAAFDGKTTLSINRNLPSLIIVNQLEERGISVTVLKDKVVLDWSSLGRDE